MGSRLFNGRNLIVKFILDFTHQFFQNVFHRNDAFRASVFVHHHRNLLVLDLKFLQ